jgi:isoleucyl-tRNA synthetase
VVDLSNVYLDIAKDRLYVSAVDSFRRRSCQTVLHLVVERLAGLIAPVLCHMAEDIWQNLPYSVAEASVFERGWPTVPEDWRTQVNTAYTFEAHTQIKDLLLVLRPMVNRLLDAGRRPVVASPNAATEHEPIGSSLEAQVQILLDAADGQLGTQTDTNGEADGEAKAAHSVALGLALLETSPHPEVDNLADWLLVSALHIGGETPSETPTEVLAEATEAGLTVRISRAKGLKCERCWHYETDIGQFSDHPSLCGRCVAVLGQPNNRGSSNPDRSR